MTPTPPAFLGGKLKLKSTDKKANKKSSKSSKCTRSIPSIDHNDNNSGNNTEVSKTNHIDILDDGLTSAERKSLKVKLEREKQELEKLARKSHRQRVEEYNEKLSTLTEHNDIPRISAAGNG